MPGSEVTLGRASAELVAPALPECLEELHDVIASLWVACPGVASEHRIRFETAVIEVAGNVVEHSVPVPRAGAVVTLRVTLDGTPDSLSAVLVDDARAFDAASIDDLDTAMPDVDAETGRGLALTRAFVDELDYARDGETNRWSIVLRRRRPGGRRRLSRCC